MRRTVIDQIFAGAAKLLNDHRLKTGGFTVRLKFASCGWKPPYGLPLQAGPRLRGCPVILNISASSSHRWFSMYSMIVFSSAAPLRKSIQTPFSTISRMYKTIYG